MRVRLVYEGELRANQRDQIGNQPDKLAQHKQAIRRQFHAQLQYNWETNWFLRDHTAFPTDYGADRNASNYEAVWGAAPHERVALKEIVAQCHTQLGYRFVPLVRREWRLACSLSILFLRHDPPGSVLTSGDLDNRVKTLIDCLRLPKNEKELRGNEAPLEGENPFYVLLEDDDLVSAINIESDRFLKPPQSNSDHDRRQAHIVVTADIRPTDVTTFNISFAS